MTARTVTDDMLDALADAIDDVALDRPEYATWVVWGFADALGDRRHERPDPVDSATEDEHKQKMDAWCRGCKAADTRESTKAGP